MKNRITELFGIKYPIIQGGMVWCSGWKLASAVSNNGGLGLIGAGSMNAETLSEHISKCKSATKNPFGVNIPLLYSGVKEQIDVVLKQEIKIVFTSAGNPKTWTSILKEHGVTVVHVVSSKKFALKSQEAGVDAVVAEGFEAGGHNGREETTTLCLVPDVVDHINIPVIAAGGIGNGRAMLAALVLGAEGVQIGSLFASSSESSASELFKQEIVNAAEGDTKLMLKKLAPVRLLRNEFYNLVETAENECAEKEKLKLLLGKGRARAGIFEGDVENGELEIGQVSSTINEIKSVKDIFENLLEEFESTKKNIV